MYCYTCLLIVHMLSGCGARTYRVPYLSLWFWNENWWTHEKCHIPEIPFSNDVLNRDPVYEGGGERKRKKERGEGEREIRKCYS